MTLGLIIMSNNIEFRILRNLSRRAAKLGFRLEEATPSAV